MIWAAQVYDENVHDRRLIRHLQGRINRVWGPGQRDMMGPLYRKMLGKAEVVGFSGLLPAVSKCSSQTFLERNRTNFTILCIGRREGKLYSTDISLQFS